MTFAEMDSQAKERRAAEAEAARPRRVQYPLIVESAWTDDGTFIGYRIAAGGRMLLVFNDQATMPGFRVGTHFTPGLGESIEYRQVEVR